MEEKQRLEFEKALESRQFEIRNFWSRGWFFGALILASIAGYYENSTLITPIFPPVCISFLIAIFSLFQTLMNRGSKYWQERWEYITKNRESVLDIDVTKIMKYQNSEKYYIDRSILSKGESWLTRGQRFSVSKLTFLVWDIIFLSSCFCWINDVLKIIDFCDPNWDYTIKIIIFQIVICVYIIMFWKKGRVYENLKNTKKGILENTIENEYKSDCENYINNKFD